MRICKNDYSNKMSLYNPNAGIICLLHINQLYQKIRQTKKAEVIELITPRPATYSKNHPCEFFDCPSIFTSFSADGY